MVYSYIVVDDEVLIRKGLMKKVESIESVNLQCVGEAPNGIKGLALVREKDPDIIITDMKMNKMSGVEFLEILGDEYPEKPVIVISGYKDFNYVKKAIEKRVIGYVLKPFSVEEIEKQILDAVSRIQQKQSIEELKEKVDSFEQRYSQEILRSVILEPWNEMLEEALIRGGYDSEALFQFAVLYIEEPDCLPVIESICSRILEKESYYVLENQVFKKQYFILFEADKHHKEKYTILTGRLTKTLLADVTEGKIFICFTDMPQRLGRLNKLYQQSESQVSRVQLGMLNGMWKIDEKPSGKLRLYTEAQIQEVFRVIKYHKEQAREIMETFFEGLSGQALSLQMIGEECESLLTKVNEYAVDHKVEIDDIMPVFYHRYLFCDDVEQMKGELSGYVSLIMNSVEMRENTQAGVLEQIERYMQDNYYKKLTLQHIASRFYMTPASSSLLLKQKLGKSFNEYMSEIRLEKAKELLCKTDLSVENISEEVGYANPKYFFKIFKKMMSCTPLEYRNESRKQEGDK